MTTNDFITALNCQVNDMLDNAKTSVSQVICQRNRDFLICGFVKVVSEIGGWWLKQFFHIDLPL